MSLLLKNAGIFIGLLLASTLTNASSNLNTYHELQNLKSDVRAAYVFSLIVDKDARAHPKRNNRIAKIDSLLEKIDNLEGLDELHRKALSMSMRVYLRSAKNEAATFDINLGSRTFSNGYSAYSELIEQIYAPIQTIQLESEIPKKTIEVFTLLDKVAAAIELHGERIIKTQRSKNMSQAELSQMCMSIKKGFENLSKYKDAKSTIKKASLKWSFIKTPICNLDKTSAPYTITHYGSLLADILKEYASKDLAAIE